ncbi:ABC transporter permease [Modestobacter roseus]|uniref:Peptide/nickel transport system permease protein n=1 Tax=Modestobacter roseus TaxID=1181884 RepID=A0A562IMX6_9ACTN|nr:ABC transporter permease [Modestobacter roseus]MQA33764.1 ABC transporter permease subunit [Modestobacter roseus]TWH72053.1 peptide/nickel transport system permease protein [Modestobacter roseus]
MTLYVVRRLATGLVLALLVTLITFLLLSPSFDGVVRSILGSAATPESVAALKERFGLDRPLLVQYGDWLGGVLQGDFGRSYFTSQEVAPAVASRLSVTLSVVLVALAVTVLISVTLGVLAAWRGGGVDRAAQGVSLVGYLIPNLLIAIVLVYVFAIQLGWLPATGYTPLSENPGRWATSILIPVIALVIAGIANMAAQVRGSMIDELRKDYVRTLRTRGISTRSVVLRHALRNAAGPALTVMSLEFISMLGGALIIENVFALPGFGSYAFNSSLQGDIPVIMGITLFTVLLVVCVNLVTDLVNGWLNPKARVL